MQGDGFMTSKLPQQLWLRIFPICMCQVCTWVAGLSLTVFLMERQGYGLGEAAGGGVEFSGLTLDHSQRIK